MHLVGYFASILIGISLGLIGGGGSILTVPVLVYLFGIDAVLATTYSLFVVGCTSAIGTFTYFRNGFIDIKTGFFFGIPSIAAVLLTKTYLVPAIPLVIFRVGAFTLTNSIFLMLLFALLMILASLSMIRNFKTDDAFDTNKKELKLLILLQGIGVGIVTGLVGAGGGFLIIPALVNIIKLPMKTAIGTSLFIIAINSLSGFFLTNINQSIDWSFLLTIAIIAVTGIIIGSYISTKIEGKKLKPAFGWFVLVTGVYILIKETVLK